MKDEEIIKCNRCNQVLISGKGAISVIFSCGCSIACRKCGNSYNFGCKETLISTAHLGDMPKKHEILGELFPT